MTDMRYLLAGAPLLGCLLCSCAHTLLPANPDGIIQALHEHDQVTINEWTTRYLEGDEVIRAEWLLDYTDRHTYVLVEPRWPWEGVNHLGVETIGDYFLCLLEIRHRRYTASILSETAPQLIATVPEGSCGICCSEAYPLPDSIRRAVADYWLAGRV